MRSFASLSALFAALAALTTAAPFRSQSIQQRQDAGRLVFAHFMMGIIPNRGSASDYDNDMKAAKAAGIDAFALNVGTDDYANEQLEYAYESAANNDMKVFISFDFAYFKVDDPASVGTYIKNFGSKPAQLLVNDKVFVSSFNGDGFSADGVRQAAGTEIYFAPNFHPGSDSSSLDGALNWVGWDNNGANRAPDGASNITVAQGDATYKEWLGEGKGYIAPVSPWFSTHYGQEVSYSKNWVFPGDLLWYNRWNEILESSPQFVEIITWNDYGESHYIGPLSSKHTDDGNSKQVNDMPHNGWLEMAKPFIAAYKAGDKAPKIEENKLVYWYRPTPKTLNCDSTDTYGSKPEGFETLQDAVFVVALLKEAGKVTVTSGENSQTFDAPAGSSAFQVPMGVGKQTFSVEVGGETLSETSLRDIVDTCPCGLYIYNAFVGTVPAGAPDALDADGLTAFKNGLKVECEAKPSLATTADAAPAKPTEVKSEASETPSITSAPALPPSAIPTPENTTEEPTPEETTTEEPTPEETPVDTLDAPVLPATTTVAASPVVGGCTATVTESLQIAPTNCLGSGQVWGGSYGSPDCCDGAAPCCK